MPLHATDVRISQDRLDKKGRVKVWHIEGKRYIRCLPIDAKEKVAGGSCLQFKPGEEPEPEEIETAPVVETIAPKDVAPKTSAVAGMLAGQGYEYAQHTVPELRSFAADAGVPNYQSMKKADLIANLERVNYVPAALRTNDGSNG